MTHEHPAPHVEPEKKDAHAAPSETEGHAEKKPEDKKVEDVATKIQVVLDKEIGGMRAYAQFVLTPEEVSNARREAARLVRAEEDQKQLLEKAVKAATPKESEEQLEGSRHADIVARESRKAIQSIFVQAKGRVVPPVQSQKPLWRKAIDKAVVPFAAAAGLLANAVNSVGVSAISSFPWLATGASAAGIIGSVGLGGYVGAKAEQMIRKAMGKRTDGKHWAGKILGGTAGFAALAFNAPVILGGVTAAATVGAAYGASRVYSYFENRYSANFKQAELLRAIRDDYKDDMPKGMLDVATGTNLHLEYIKIDKDKEEDKDKSKDKPKKEPKIKVVDVSKAADKPAMLLLVKKGIDELKKEVDEKKHVEDAKSFTKLLGSLHLPDGITMDIASAHEKKITLSYHHHDVPVDCTRIDDTGVIAHIEREAHKHQHDIDHVRKVSFESALAKLDLPSEMAYEDIGLFRVKLTMDGESCDVPCADTAEGNIESKIENAGKAFEQRIKQKKEKNFKKAVRNFEWTPTIIYEFKPGTRIINVKYGTDERSISLEDTDDSMIHKVIKANIGGWLDADRRKK